MTDLLQEYCNSRGVSMRVDRQSGVIRGVKLLGLESKNGRSYLPEALGQAISLYEDAKVNVNHSRGNPTAPRDYQDRIGAIRNVTFQPGEGLFGDFHFNPKHALAEQLAWDAEHASENVGFSHNVEAKVGRRGDRVVVESITRVQSVDLVADPATTRGLFESADVSEEKAAPMTLEDLKRDYPTLIESLWEEQAAELQRLKQEVERLTASEAVYRKRDAIRRLLREFHLPDLEATDARAKVVVSAPFCESLMAAPDDKALRTLVEERARLVQTLAGGDAVRGFTEMQPLSKDQLLAFDANPWNGKSFVEAIT